MSARLAFFTLICVLSSIWAATVLFGYYVRFDHQELISAIRDGGTTPDAVILEDAITDYENALHITPCAIQLHQDRILLLAQKSDAAMATSDVAGEGVALDEMHAALTALLECTPDDGKAWLDLAMINIYREGFNQRSLDAYTASARAAPGESWLAEKRLLFALQFRALFDAKARQVALNDILVLERAHPNRIKAVMEAAQVETPAALRTLFAD